MVKGSLAKSGSALGGMGVLDLFFYILLAVCIVFQTWGYSFGDTTYIGAVALAGILAAAKMLASRYTGRDLIVCVVLLGVGLYFAAKAHRYTVLLTVVLIIAAKGIETRKLLTGFLGIKTVALVSFFVFAALGAFDVESVQHYRMTTGVFETRVLINGASTNILHLGFFTIATLWLCLKYERIRMGDVAVLLFLDGVLYLGVTRSTAGVALTAVAVLLIFASSKLKGLERSLLRLAPLAPFALMLVMVFLGYAYGSSGFMDFVNKLSTGRIAYDHYWLTTYGPTLLGSDFAELIGEGNFDDSFVYILVVYGFLFALLLYGAVTRLLIEIKRGGDAPGALLVVLFLIYSAAESMYPSAVVNPSLFLVGGFLFDGQPKAGGLGDDDEQRSGCHLGGSPYSHNRMYLLRRHVPCGATGTPCFLGVLPYLCGSGSPRERGRTDVAGYPSCSPEPCHRNWRACWWERIIEHELSYPNPVCDLRRSLLLCRSREARQTDVRRAQQMVLGSCCLVWGNVLRWPRSLVASAACYAQESNLLVHGLLRREGVPRLSRVEGSVLSAIRLDLRCGGPARFFRYGDKLAGVA